MTTHCECGGCDNPDCDRCGLDYENEIETHQSESKWAKIIFYTIITLLTVGFIIGHFYLSSI